MNKRIVITGPRSVGKSTTAIMLADRLGYDYVGSDDLLDEILRPYGGLAKVLDDRRQDIVNDHVMEACERALERDRIVFDLAGGALLVKEGTLGDRVRRTVMRKALVIGLLPSLNDLVSIDFLYARERERPHFSSVPEAELKEKVRRDYLALKAVLKGTARHIVYTGALPPAKVVERCASLV